MNAELHDKSIILSRVLRKILFCICENKDADQFRESAPLFSHIDIAIPILSKSEISSLQPSSVAVQHGLCLTRSETRMLVFSWPGSYICSGIGPHSFL